MKIKDRLYIDVVRYFSKAQKTAFLCLLVLSVLLGVLLPFLYSRLDSGNIKLSREYVAGELSDETVVSPISFSFVDEVETKKAKENAQKAIFPYYSLSLSKTLEMRNILTDYLKAIIGGNETVARYYLSDAGYADTLDVTSRLLSLSAENLLVISRLIEENQSQILLSGVFSAQELNTSNAEGYYTILFDNASGASAKRISTEDLITEATLFKSILDQAYSSYSNLTYEDIKLISDAVDLFTYTNVFYDEYKTNNMRQEASLNTPSSIIYIEKGDEIIRRDEVITERMLRIVDIINNQAPSADMVNMLVQAVFLITVLAFGIYFFVYFIPYHFRTPLYSLLFLSGLVLTEILTFLWLVLSIDNYQSYSPSSIMPYLYLPVMFTCITNRRRIGFITGFVLSGFAVIYQSSDKYTFFNLIVIIEASVMFIRFGTNRIDIIYEAFYSSIVAALTTGLFSLFAGYSYQMLVNNMILVVLNVVVSYIAVSITLPLLEKIFNLPTIFRLHELSYTDTPTLNRLAHVAQGTFNHVRNVSDMSYQAAKAIGANAELTRVGALYHDIGKSEHPEYFIENQSGKNAHDQITTSLSAAIIKSHVRLGVEKAKEIGLPQEVINIISEHHGNDIITYFYNEAKKEASGNMSVSEEDYRYNGEPPQSPESAIVMLADCTEAASRTLKNPNTNKYDRLISNIIISKINHNQLSQSSLTLTDLDIIKDTFILSLVGRDHQRIEYDNKES